MSVDPFECLLRINRGFAEVLEGLRALRKQRGFEPEQVRRFEQLAQETRAATNSHLLGVLESQETNEAGRLFRRRLERERRDEHAPPSE